MLAELLLQDPGDDDYEDDHADTEVEEYEEVAEEGESSDEDGKGQVLGKPKMEVDRSLNDDHHEKETKDGKIVKIKGAVKREDVERGVFGDAQLAEIRATQRYKYMVMVERQVSQGYKLNGQSSGG